MGSVVRYRTWDDDDAVLAEAVSQVLLGMVFVGAGLAIFLVPGHSTVGAWAWLAIWSLAGAGNTVWAGYRIWWTIYRFLSMRDMMVGTARVLGSRPTDEFVDEVSLRRFVYLNLAVTLPTGPERTIRVRQALSPEQENQLKVGTVVVVRAHPVRSVAEIDPRSLELDTRDSTGDS